MCRNVCCSLLVAVQTEVLEWRVITRWDHSHHRRLPAAFQDAAKTLLAAATHHPSNSSSSATARAGTPDSSSDGQQLFAQVPGAVLEQVVGAAALPQGSWAATSVPSYSQLSEALERRPPPPQEEMGFGGVGWPAFLAGAGQGGVMMGGW